MDVHHCASTVTILTLLQSDVTDVTVGREDGRIKCSFVRASNTTVHYYDREEGMTHAEVHTFSLEQNWYLEVAWGDVYKGKEAFYFLLLFGVFFQKHIQFYVLYASFHVGCYSTSTSAFRYMGAFEGNPYEMNSLW